MRKRAILMPTAIGADSYRYVNSAAEFHARSGVHPIMKQECDTCHGSCLCGMDFEATAEEGNLRLDIGDRYDLHDYWFITKKAGENPNWPSQTGKPSGRRRGNKDM
jgi:ribosomal protein L31